MSLVWITGARGFLGRHVARRYAAAGYAVAGIGLEGAADAALKDLPLASVQGVPCWISGAITEESLEHLVKLAGVPDVVVHAAGSGAVGASFSDPLRDFRLTVETTAIVLNALRRHAPHARFVLPSSAAVYGAKPKGPISESSSVAPVSPYGAHKVAAEALCLGAQAAFNQKISIVRYFSLYGPTLRKQLLFDIGQKLKNDPPELVLAGTGDETRDFLHSEDAAELAFLAGTATESEYLLVNGGTGHSVTVREAVESLARALERRTRFRFTNEVREGDPRHLCADTAHLATLGFKPSHRFADGVATYAAWLSGEWAGAECNT